MMGKPKFGKAELEKVRNGVDLIPLLQERDLHGINNLSFIKTLLKQMKREDLLKEVCNYEKESGFKYWTSLNPHLGIFFL